MLKRFAAIIFLLSPLTLLFCGCWDNAVIEENTIVTLAGVDTQDKADHTFTLATVETFTDDEPKFITVKADIMSEALVKANNRAANPVRSGKIQNIVFSREGAEQGYIPLVDIHKIEEVSRFLPDYLISTTTAAEIFEALGKMKLEEKSLTYLSHLVKTAADSGFCPDISSRDYNLDFINEGPDPVLPLLAADNGKIFVKGTALFAKEKMVGELPATESVFLNLLLQKKSAFSYYIHFPIEDAAFDTAVFQTKRCNAKIAASTKGDDVIIDINIKINGLFDKFIWSYLNRVYGAEKVEKHIESYFNTNVKSVFTVLQSCNCDPLDIRGSLKKNDFDFYNTHDFSKVYSKAKVNVSTELNIINDPNPDLNKAIEPK
ncbi:MAG: Ger(x)C family spore germination C-terminal domain-containing protein [Bacillota bacterium]|nr:Ger(x)C family spore germination C-terminal domain-containing protein [Bacillota bacterium]